MVTDTSLSAFREILNNLGLRQQEVYFAIKELVEADNLSISKFLNIPINSVTPRVFELRDKKLVGVSKQDISPITKRKVIFWKVIR